MKKHIFDLTQAILDMAHYEKMLEDRLAEQEFLIGGLQDIIRIFTFNTVDDND